MKNCRSHGGIFFFLFSIELLEEKNPTLEEKKQWRCLVSSWNHDNKLIPSQMRKTFYINLKILGRRE